MAMAGRLVVRHEGEATFIEQADPVVIISAAMLDAVRRGETSAVLAGDILRIAAADRTVVYRIGEYVPDEGGFLAEWPD